MIIQGRQVKKLIVVGSGSGLQVAGLAMSLEVLFMVDMSLDPILTVDQKTACSMQVWKGIVNGELTGPPLKSDQKSNRDGSDKSRGNSRASSSASRTSRASRMSRESRRRSKPPSSRNSRTKLDDIAEKKRDEIPQEFPGIPGHDYPVHKSVYPGTRFYTVPLFRYSTAQYSS